MNEILEPLQKLDKILTNSPLIQALSHLVDIEVGVVGGALRDTLLEKPIKDIDIHIQINLWKNLKVDRNGLDYRDEFIDEKISSREADAILTRSREILEFMQQDMYRSVRENYPPHNDGVKAIICLVKQILTEHSDYKLKEETRKIIVDNGLGIQKIAYFNMGLNDVVAITDNKSKYPIELLFSQDSISSFTHDFDFNLCKIYMTPDGDMVKSKGFIADAENKIMTYEPKMSITEKDIQKSLFVRYERLHEKYGDYSLVAKTDYLSEKIKSSIEEAIKISKSYHLLKDLPEKNNSVKRNKL